MQVELLGTVVDLEFYNYANNDRTRISAVVAETGEPFIDVTVNIDHIMLRDNEIILNPDGNGIHEELQRQGVVGPKLYPARCGMTYATVCELIINKKQEEL